jgi:hypothetical protein
MITFKKNKKQRCKDETYRDTETKTKNQGKIRKERGCEKITKTVQNKKKHI